jgi:hypothetical protein
VVDKDSAVLGYPAEEDVPLAADHRDLVRYPSLQDDTFDFVTKTIRFKVQEILRTATADQGMRLSIPLLGAAVLTITRIRTSSRYFCKPNEAP